MAALDPVVLFSPLYAINFGSFIRHTTHEWSLFAADHP
jgi:hypothetical protein